MTCLFDFLRFWCCCVSLCKDQVSYITVFMVTKFIFALFVETVSSVHQQVTENILNDYHTGLNVVCVSFKMKVEFSIFKIMHCHFGRHVGQ